jgi:hypothetical protein
MRTAPNPSLQRHRFDRTVPDGWISLPAASARGRQVGPGSASYSVAVVTDGRHSVSNASLPGGACSAKPLIRRRRYRRRSALPSIAVCPIPEHKWDSFRKPWW